MMHPFIRGGAFALVGLTQLLPRGRAVTEVQKAERRRERPQSLCFAIGFFLFSAVEFWGGSRSVPANLLDDLGALAVFVIIVGIIAKIMAERRAKRRGAGREDKLG